jgi:hypothetical protein
LYRVIQPNDPKSSEKNAVDNEEDLEVGGNKSDGSKTESPVRVPSGVADSLQTPSPDVSTPRNRPTAKLAPSGVHVYGQRCGLHSSAIVRAAFKGWQGSCAPRGTWLQASDGRITADERLLERRRIGAFGSNRPRRSSRHVFTFYPHPLPTGSSQADSNANGTACRASSSWADQRSAPLASNQVTQETAAIHRDRRRSPPWGYQRIAGELKRLGLAVSPTTVRKVLNVAGVRPAPERARQSWRSFLRQQVASTLACDFFTVETLALQRIYVLFFISLATRRLEVIACTANPDGAWVTQQARNLVMQLGEQGRRFELLIHDRDTKFSRAFDEAFRAEASTKRCLSNTECSATLPTRSLHRRSTAHSRATTGHRGRTECPSSPAAGRSPAVCWTRV